MEQMKLFAVASTPDTEKQMDPQSNPIYQRKGMVQQLGLGTHCLPAVWRKRGPGGFDFVQPEFHAVLGKRFAMVVGRRSWPTLTSFQRLFANQLASRHCRSAMRARCSITHRLLSVIFRSSQTSLPVRPSTSRRLNTVATFSGSFPVQLR